MPLPGIPADRRCRERRSGVRPISASPSGDRRGRSGRAARRTDGGKAAGVSQRAQFHYAIRQARGNLTRSLSEYSTWPYLNGFAFNRGGADEVGSIPNKEATTMIEGKSVRVLRVGSARGVCGVARLTRNTQTGS